MPFGRDRFSRETGIRRSDWLGKIWARWGDALREAGFEPNQLQGPYDEDELLKAYIALTRDLGRLPVDAELRIRRSSHPDFPSHTTFFKFGGRGGLVERVLEYCRTREGYEDIIKLCEAEGATRGPTSDQEPVQKDEFGFVYLMKSGRFYKIGRSNAAGRREYELAIQLPERPTTVHVIRTDDHAGIEAYWHNRFALKRKGGEWFDLSRADVEAFRRRKFM